jgi:hypothetical protein
MFCFSNAPFTTSPRSPENLRRGVEALAPHRVEARRQAVQFAWKKNMGMSWKS